MTEKKKTGFALQDPKKRKESAKKGGHALQAKIRALKEMAQQNDQNNI